MSKVAAYIRVSTEEQAPHAGQPPPRRKAILPYHTVNNNPTDAMQPSGVKGSVYWRMINVRWGKRRINNEAGVMKWKWMISINQN